METGFRNMATRIENAERHMISSIMDLGGLTNEEAAKVFLLYKKHKAIKLDPVIGRYIVKHGAFMDREQIRYVANK